VIADEPTALERQNDDPGTSIGPEPEMRERWLRDQAEHEAVLRALGIPIAGQPPNEDDDISDLNEYDYLLEK